MLEFAFAPLNVNGTKRIGRGIRSNASDAACPPSLAARPEGFAVAAWLGDRASTSEGKELPMRLRKWLQYGAAGIIRIHSNENGL